MRKDYDGLGALVTHELKRDPLSGEVFVFVSRNSRNLAPIRTLSRAGRGRASSYVLVTSAYLHTGRLRLWTGSSQYCAMT